jgi:putative PIN family toxin of toxin-antitoxin system
MKYAVIDTNVLVSAFWSADSVPAEVMALVLNGAVIPCYDYRIIEEYREVLSRAKFGFDAGEVDEVLSFIEKEGLSVVATPLEIDLPDDSDKKFFEVAEYTGATLVTGNIRHYPSSDLIMTPADYMDRNRK